MNPPLIAVVDDEPELLENFKALLADQFEVVTFNSPATFLSDLPSLQKKNLRLVITDFKMPGQTGLEMVIQAHQMAGPIPFIILSGFLDKKTVLAAVDMGAFRLLEKPADPEEVLASIDQLLMESNLTDVRHEIRQITLQLRELYSGVRMALLQYIPESVMERMIVADPDQAESKQMSFENLLEQLEHRLDELLKSEKVINELKTNRWKS